MTVVDPGGRRLILINTFEVIPANADARVDVLHDASGSIGRMPGFISADPPLDTFVRIVA